MSAHRFSKISLLRQHHPVTWGHQHEGVQQDFWGWCPKPRGAELELGGGPRATQQREEEGPFEMVPHCIWKKTGAASFLAVRDG